MKMRRILNISILIIGIAVIVCFGYAFAENQTFGGTAQKIVGYIIDNSSQVIWSEDENEGLVQDWLKDMVGDKVKSLGNKYLEAIQGLLFLYRLGFLIPAVLAAVVMVLVWVLQKRWRYLAAFAGAVMGALSFPLVEILIVPLSIFGNFQKTGLMDWVSDKVHWTDFGKIAADFLGVECWIGLGLLLLLAVLCMAGFFVKETVPVLPAKGQQENKQKARMEQEKRVQMPPVLRGLAGIYSGGTIPISHGETLFLGANSKVCNIILAGEGIAARHCSVRYDEMEDVFVIEDMSEAGTYTNGNRKLQRGKMERLERNSILILGSDENIFMLE